LVDFFSSVDEPQAGPSSSGMGAFGGSDPFSQQQHMLHQQQQQLQSQMMMNQQALSGLPNPFMQGMMMGGQQQQPPQMNANPFMMGGQQQPSSFPPSYPQSQVFTPSPTQQPMPSSVNVMKTNNTIDPFASLAASRTSKWVVFP
jgi:hypothetical protein